MISNKELAWRIRPAKPELRGRGSLGNGGDGRGAGQGKKLSPHITGIDLGYYSKPPDAEEAKISTSQKSLDATPLLHPKPHFSMQHFLKITLQKNKLVETR